jgi:hypothetical protein
LLVRLIRRGDPPPPEVREFPGDRDDGRRPRWAGRDRADDAPSDGDGATTPEPSPFTQLTLDDAPGGTVTDEAP